MASAAGESGLSASGVSHSTTLPASCDRLPSVPFIRATRAVTVTSSAQTNPVHTSRTSGQQLRGNRILKEKPHRQIYLLGGVTAAVDEECPQVPVFCRKQQIRTWPVDEVHEGAAVLRQCRKKVTLR